MIIKLPKKGNLMKFIDFEKAFDSINRDFIWDVLRRRGITGKLIGIIKATYEGAKCQVLLEEKVSEDFEVQSGVRQGWILSPLLVLVLINYVLQPYRMKPKSMEEQCFQHKI